MPKYNYEKSAPALDPQAQMILAAAAEDFTTFCFVLFPNFQRAMHHKVLIEKLTEVERGLVTRLMIFMPPRHGKSVLASILFVAWYLGRNPTHSVIFATYGQTLGDHFGRQVRNILANHKFRAIFPKCVLSFDSQANYRFSTTAGGEYLAVGRGGPITGRGANLLVIDDPLKDAMEAGSETIRDSLNEWYSKVAYTRLAPKGAVVLIGTRWHVQDLFGWLQKEHGDESWHTLAMPAIAESDEGWRKEGDALWPERFPPEELFKIQAQVGPQGWTSLYQQKPSLEGGYIFNRKWIRHFTKPPRRVALNRYILVDPANTKKKKSDATAIVVIGLASDKNYYVVDMVREFANLTERGELVFKLHRTWHPIAVGYESYGLQTDVPYLKDKMDRENYHFEVIPVGGNVTKVDRIRRLVPLFQNGRVYLPNDLVRTNSKGETLDLVKYFVDKEFASYPAVQHDDLLDAMARIVDPEFPTVFPMTWEEQADLEQSRKQRKGSWMSA